MGGFAWKLPKNICKKSCVNFWFSYGSQKWVESVEINFFVLKIVRKFPVCSSRHSWDISGSVAAAQNAWDKVLSRSSWFLTKSCRLPSPPFTEYRRTLINAEHLNFDTDHPFLTNLRLGTPYDTRSPFRCRSHYESRLIAEFSKFSWFPQLAEMLAETAYLLLRPRKTKAKNCSGLSFLAARALAWLPALDMGLSWQKWKPFV